jgi:hypothetical protein
LWLYFQERMGNAVLFWDDEIVGWTVPIIGPPFSLSWALRSSNMK